MERRVTYGGAVSLDGYLAGPRGEIDWLHFSNDVQQIMSDYWKKIDTILMGRKTYEFARAQQPPRKQNPKRRTEDIPAKKTYVFSRTLSSLDDRGAELVADAVPFVQGLKNQPGKEICLMGGGELAQSLLAAGLVDEIGLNIHPVVLGSGVPVFRDPGQRVRLRLTECRRIEGGCIMARYAVEGP